MKTFATVIAIAAGGALALTAVAAVLLLPVDHAAHSYSQLIGMLQSRGGALAAIFLIAFGILTFIVSVATVWRDLARANKRLSRFSGLPNDALLAAFADTSIFPIIQHLNETLTSFEAERNPYGLRMLRLEIWRAVLHRAIGYQIVTVLLYAIYSAVTVQLSEPSLEFGYFPLPLPNIAAFVVALVLGTWITIDDAIDNIVGESARFGQPYRPGSANDELTSPAMPSSSIFQDVISAIELSNRRIETIDDALFDRVAALLNAAKDEILTGQKRDKDITMNSETRNAVRSTLDTSTRILSQMNRLFSEQEKLLSTLKTPIARLDDWPRLSADIVAKLNTIEGRLSGLGNNTITGDGPAASTVDNTAKVTSAVAKDLESILAELRGRAS
jgi:hypothetical protein